MIQSFFTRARLHQQLVGPSSCTDQLRLQKEFCSALLDKNVCSALGRGNKLAGFHLRDQSRNFADLSEVDGPWARKLTKPLQVRECIVDAAQVGVRDILLTAEKLRQLVCSDARV